MAASTPRSQAIADVTDGSAEGKGRRQRPQNGDCGLPTDGLLNGLQSFVFDPLKREDNDTSSRALQLLLFRRSLTGF